mgnify:CR=1 FL=1|tara:strand:+ start:15109 stop:16455 length:1347 start_codon:yes stop_codon:yes gene_type:complete
MFEIKINDFFYDEKKYIIETIFLDFIGTDKFKIITSSSFKDYTITHSSDPNKKIILKDDFFLNIKSNNYLDKRNLPDGYSTIEHNGENIAFPYGNSKISFDLNSIMCGADLFASAFFMLTRWEEVVEESKDIYGRFPEEMSWAIKHGLIMRPLVNEYVSFLMMMMNDLKLPLVFDEKRVFTPIISHDIDNIARYDSPKKIISALCGDIILRKSLKSLFNSITDIIKIKLKIKKDNYDTFDFLMNLSDSIDVKSRFYFIPGLLGEFDVRYNYNSEKVIKKYKKILKRKHIIGIHPSYNSFLNYEILKKEKERIENIVGQDIKEGRQHYLRFQVPDTWQQWDDLGIEHDSTLGFENYIGFRTGSCYSYTVFNVKTKKKLKLREETLNVMDVALINISPSLEKQFYLVNEIVSQVKKYNGDFNLLWHNNNFFHHAWLKYVPLYKGIINSLK